jgi:coenzyme F420-0:L-glutamate ligase / coenzyme F420-1:gamma-L-glutamate ligase
VSSPGPSEILVIPVEGIKRVRPGDDLAALIFEALQKKRLELQDDDILVVTQKVVSKSEGRMVRLDEVKPTNRASVLASELGKDPRMIELILRESTRVVRKGHGVLITETRHGFVCANSGVDVSNVETGYAALLPLDPDASSRGLRESLERATTKRLAVVVSDTFGRPWREGHTDVAIGCSGIAPTQNLAGRTDSYDYVLRVTQPAIVDEVAGVAELVMTKLSMIPVAIVRGVRYDRAEVGVKSMIRKGSMDLFR